MSRCFQQKKINTFDVLTFIQMRTVSKITAKFLDSLSNHLRAVIYNSKQKLVQTIIQCLRNIFDPTIRLNHSNPQKRYSGEKSAPHNSFLDRLGTLKAVSLIRSATEPCSLIETKSLAFVVICVLKVLRCNIVISIHDFVVILLWCKYS